MELKRRRRRRRRRKIHGKKNPLQYYYKRDIQTRVFPSRSILLSREEKEDA